MNAQAYYVYILANKKRGTLYTGVTNNIMKRIFEHKQNSIPGFTSQYHIHILVYYEIHQDIKEAILREKQIKKWRREWKINLIESHNSQWEDLYKHIADERGSPPPRG